MKESFEELFLALKKNREKCPWSKDATIEKYIDELMSEAEEVKQAIQNENNGNLKEELGDLLMDLMFISIIAEEKGHFDLREVIDTVKSKLIRRKPWVFGNEKVFSKEEASKRWNEIKEQEKWMK